MSNKMLYVTRGPVARPDGRRAWLGPRATHHARRCTPGVPPEPTRRGVEIASQVVRTYEDYTRDPSVLDAAKLEAIHAILDLDAPPRVILQTNPLEHSAVAGNCAIDVHGWAEPGTSVKINGRETPVAPDGLFLEQAPPSREGTIVLEAKSDKGRKTLVRRFRLLDGSGPARDSEP